MQQTITFSFGFYNFRRHLKLQLKNTSKSNMCMKVILQWKNQTYSYTRKGHCVFLQRIMERFLSGSLRAFQWEGARDVKIGANHWHTTAELHYLPTYLRWKHQNILTDPLPLGQFLHLLPTPLWIMRLLSSFSRQRVCLFQRGLDFWEGGSAVFGTIGPFYESQHPLQAHAPSLLSAHFQRLCCCWLWSSGWE